QRDAVKIEDEAEDTQSPGPDATIEIPDDPSESLAAYDTKHPKPADTEIDDALSFFDDDGSKPDDETVDATIDIDAGDITSALTEIYRPDDSGDTGGASGPDAFEDLLTAREIVTPKELLQAQAVVSKSPGTRLSDVLIERGADEEKVLRVLAESWSLAFETLDLDKAPDEIFDGTMLQRLGTDFCKEYEVLPVRVEDGRVILGTSRPDDVFMIDEARMRLKARAVRPVVVSGAQIRAALDLLGEDESEHVTDVESILDDIEEDDVRVEESGDDEVDLEREAAESPVIRYVNYIIQTAVKEGASDIHIEPGDKTLIVRYRIDGVLFEAMRPPNKMAAAITSRLKIMANLDISERRIPQDGRIRCNVQGRKLDLRVSTLPTSYGEKTVMRILDTKNINVSLDDLGFDENTLTIWKNQIAQPHGIVLVTGPTGSGKTTTLYASLRQMDKVSQNVSTVEDPVEYHLDGITQTQVHEKIGMTFASALRALLRQDPDVIMLGEIRDMETAGIAIQAALTGHLVLSTLHTNDAPSAITRLVNIGIEPFLIGAAVNAVLAQRLVRRVCQNCKKPAEHTDDMREFLEMQGIPLDAVVEGEGCEKCRQLGYSGRLGLYELLVVDDSLRDVVARNPNVTEFRRMCCDRGMHTLRQDGFAKVSTGQTTPAEVLRVTEAMA
ncbi:xpsE, partial [Symbiodinium necroappetens]